jgi:heptosyltransferase-1
VRVCIVKTSALGDIVQAFPVLSYLNERFSGVQIDWVVEAKHAELVSAHPLVQRAIAVDTPAWRRRPTLGPLQAFCRRVRQERYDVVFDLQGNLKSGLLTWPLRSAHKVGFGWATVAEWPNLLFTNRRFNPTPNQNICIDYLQLVQRYFGDKKPFVPKGFSFTISQEQTQALDAIFHSKERHILVCPGSAWRNKQLPVSTLVLLLQRIAAIAGGHYLFSWGSSEEREMAVALHQAFVQRSVLLERYPLAMLQNLMQRVDLVISMDSLPLHLAAMAGTPTFALFGPSSAAKYNPAGAQHGAFQGACPYGRSFTKRCPVLRTCPTGACLRDQAVDELFASFMAWWKTSS